LHTLYKGHKRIAEVPPLLSLFRLDDVIAPVNLINYWIREDRMAKKIEVSEIIDRPVADVFRFFAVEHVRNHPRWDPDIELWLDKPGPLQVGTVIKRRNRRSGTPVEGTMEVVEFEPNRAIGMLIHDGPAVMNGRTIFEDAGDNRTKITTLIEIPAMDEAADPSFLLSRLEHSSQVRKQLMEAEI
jgi:uncharacterized protein YndB with AHSA1/START domain